METQHGSIITKRCFTACKRAEYIGKLEKTKEENITPKKNKGKKNPKKQCSQLLKCIDNIKVLGRKNTQRSTIWRKIHRCKEFEDTHKEWPQYLLFPKTQSYAEQSVVPHQDLFL